MSFLRYTVDGNDISATLVEIEENYERLKYFGVERVGIHEFMYRSCQINGELSRDKWRIIKRANFDSF